MGSEVTTGGREHRPSWDHRGPAGTFTDYTQAQLQMMESCRNVEEIILTTFLRIAPPIGLLLFGFRLIGMPSPSWTFWYSLVFWAFFVVWQGALISLPQGWKRVPRSITFVGGFINAVVVMANGGYMPVIEMRLVPSGSVWRHAAAGDHFLWLADRNSLHGFSAGDCVLLGSFAVWLVGFASVSIYRSLEKGRIGAGIAA